MRLLQKIICKRTRNDELFSKQMTDRQDIIILNILLPCLIKIKDYRIHPGVVYIESNTVFKQEKRGGKILPFSL